MDSAKWKIVKETYSAAAELPPEAREKFWENVDPEIRSEVENLLAAHENAENFIAESLPIDYGLIEKELDKDFTGKIIGSYKLLEEIGAGGMGTVYLAERINADFKQKFALKLIKRGMDSEAVLNRFILERRILAQLEHPNIARLIDGGSTEDGLPYFVMEYVEGETITKFCNHHFLDVKERLELFRTVCAAVEYAHQNLIVHRDLKPSNILITKDGIPKLLDFGIAKILDPDRTDSAENTVTLARMFTPEYASPEHLRGKMTTTVTDVYSLGIVLYELLTGRRPYNFENKSFEEIAETAETSEPVRPSSVADEDKNITAPQRQKTNEVKGNTGRESVQGYKTLNSNALKGDVDNIVLKAIRRDPKRRYQSINEFSEDIRRHLNGLPVSAMADTAFYRFSKFVERHRAGVLVSTAFILLITAISAIAVWQAVAARRAQARAEMRFNQVREIANTVLFDYYDKIRELSGTIELRQKIVSDSVKYLDNLAQENTGDVSLKRELIKAYNKVSEVQFGLINGNIGDSAGALQSATKAVEIAEQVTKDKEAAPSDWQILADMYISLAGARGETGDLKADVAYKEKAIEIYERIYDADPNNVEAENNLAKAYFYIATPMRFTGDFGGAVENLLKSAAIYQKLAEQVPNDPKYIRSIALSYKYLAAVYLDQKNVREAVSFAQKASEIDEKRVSSASNFQTKYDLSRSYEILALSLLENGNTIEAENAALKSVDLVREVSDANPKNNYYHDSYGISLKTLSNVRLKQNRLDESLKLTNQAISGWEATIARDSTDVFTTVFLANAYTQVGEIYLSFAEKQINSPQSKENLINAENWFKKSETLWQSLKENQSIFEYYKKDFEKVSAGIQKCGDHFKKG